MAIDSTVVYGPSLGRIEVIETQTLGADAQNITFSNLNGDADGGYIITAKWNNNGVATSCGLSMNGNACTVVDLFNGDGAAGTISGLAGRFLFCEASRDAACTIFVEARTGNVRFAKAISSSSRGATGVWNFVASAVWADSSTNLTSIAMTGGNANYFKSGSTFTIRRMRSR